MEVEGGELLDLNTILTRFHGVQKRNNNSYQCKCPCHDDKTASLTITQDRDKILLHCHAGCNTQSIMAAVGLKMTDLMPDNSKRRQEYTWREKLEYWKKKKIEAVYDYNDDEGKYLYSKVRFTDKDMLFCVVDFTKNQFKVGLKEVKERTLYKKEYISAAIENDFTVYYVEGEKDVETLQKIGLMATTAGGVNDWKSHYSNYFKGANVVILPDNDNPGKELAERVKKDISDVVKSVKVVITSQKDKGDVTDYIQEGHTKEDLLRLIEDTKEPEQEIDRTQFHKYKDGRVVGVYDAVIMDYIIANFDLFTLGNTIYIYHNGVYIRDGNGSILKSKIQQLIFRDILSVRTINRIYELIIIQPELKKETWELNNYPDSWINFKNGMLDVKTNELLPHSPNYLSINQIPHDYKIITRQELPNYPNTMYFLESALDSEDIPTILQFMGLCMTHNVDHQFFLLLLGEGGNGKSIVISLMEHIVGLENTSNMSLAKLSSNQFAASQLFGKLVNTCADLSKVSIEDDAEIKKITGGDRILCEYKGKDAFSFAPYAKLFFSANRFPHVDDKSEGFKRRLRIVSMNKKPEKKDIQLKQKLLKEIEILIFMATQWLKDVLETGEVYESEESKRLKEEASKKSDSVYSFIIDCLEPMEGHDIKRSEVFREYKEYCEYFDRMPVGKKVFFDEMIAKGFTAKKDRKGDYIYSNFAVMIWKDEEQHIFS